MIVSPDYKNAFLNDPLETIKSYLNEQQSESQLFFRDANRDYSYQDLVTDIEAKKLSFSRETSINLMIDDSNPIELLTSLFASFYTHVHLHVISALLPEDIKHKYQKSITEVAPSKQKLPQLTKEFFRKDHPFSLLSSGSTRDPKWIELSYQNIFYSAFSTIETFNYTPSDKSLLNLPLNHVGGLMVFFRALFSFSSVIHLKSFQNSKINNPITLLSIVPTQLEQILSQSHPYLTLDDLNHCKAVYIGGGPLKKESQLKAKNFGIPLIETYGMTESSSMVLVNGKSLPHAEVKIGKNNRILIKSKSLSRSVDHLLDSDGFYPTQDEGEVVETNQDKKIFFSRRMDLLIKSGGELIDPLAVENIIKNIFPDSELYLSTLPHLKWGETLVLIIDSQSTLNLKKDETIIEELKIHLHPYQVPKFIMRMNLSKDKLGIKISRFQLKKSVFNELCKNIFQVDLLESNQSDKLNHKDKKLTIISHGFMEDKDDWKKISQELQKQFMKKKMTFMLFNHSGHGEKQASFFHYFKNREDYFFYFSLYLKEMMTTYSSLDLIGYSMGGRFFIDLLPHLDKETLSKIQNLVFISTFFGFKKHEFKEKSLRLQADNSLFDNVINYEEFFTKWYQQPLFNNYFSHPQFQEDLAKKKQRKFNFWQEGLKLLSPAQSINSFEENMNFFSQLPNDNVNMKLYLIVGSLDQKYLLHNKEVVTILNTKANLSIIKNAAHNIHKTHQLELSELLSDFLEESHQ